MDPIFCAVTDIATGRLDLAEALDFISDPGLGGIALFLGRVRHLNHDRQVTGISYDMFDALALTMFKSIAQQAAAEFGPEVKVYVAHAHGRLAIGDHAVVVAVGTPHRDAAFRACRQVIEAVKHRAPIWKQQHFEDGDSAWSEGCSLCEPHAHGEAADVHHGHAH
ncbi:MAG: molybdenum cofactor biosynthesis protein MoaE [Gammaproteobacteria bacterium]|nr:molybdenum cofactor biosynthesis protein MoaE [Gammaproteobacteria bacterium]